MPTSVVFAHIAAGGVILLAGRKLFWVFIAVAGFFLGAEVAGDLLIGHPSWLIWVTAVFAGLAGALLAVLLQRVAFIVAGFYSGGYLAIVLVQSFGWPISDTVVSILGGIIGALFVAIAMDWAIIVISSLAGSTIIVTALELQSIKGLLIGGVLAGLGVIVQMAYLPKTSDSSASKNEKESVS